jgi:phytoene synthase
MADEEGRHVRLDEAYAQAYKRCEAINREHGRSYYLATRLLPAHKRRHVHALYGFTRWTDDIVDELAAEPVELRQRRLEEWGGAFASALATGQTDDPLLPAVLDTVRRYALDTQDFDAFLRSMAMDLKVNEYETYDDLLAYMEGSAAVIGTLMLPILGTVPGADPDVARASARELGFAFQLTNFIRDVREDLERGRVYLPAEDLARFGVSPGILRADAEQGHAGPEVRNLLAYECRRARLHYAAALPGLALLEPRSRICIRAAYLLYGGILREVATRGYDVMSGRARVPRRRRAAMIAAAASDRLFARWISGWSVV